MYVCVCVCVHVRACIVTFIITHTPLIFIIFSYPSFYVVMDSGNNEDEITTTTTDNTAATATNNKKEHDSDANKCFILDYVVDDDVLLPFEFYSDLSVGIYIALKFVRIRDVFHFWGNHKKKSGYYDYGLLVYCKKENRFTQLLPC